ncbi:MAG: type II secretion system F family protein [Nitrososphaerota archaeon]
MSLIKSLKKKDDVEHLNKKEIDQEIKTLEKTPGLAKAKEEQKKKDKAEISSFYAIAYRLLAHRVAFLFPRLISLESKLKQAGMLVHYEAYVCGLVLTSLVGGIIGVVFGASLSLVFKMNPPELAIMLPVILGSVLSQVIFGFMMMYPNFNIKSRASRISAELPYFIGYMATLSASGLGLEGIFKSIAKEDTKEELVKDARLVSRNLEILGMDIITALKDLIQRTPPGGYNEMLEGLVSTVESGGNMQEYFSATAKVQLEEKKLLLKKMTSSLGIVAEMYTILMIVFPLLSVIILSIMAIMVPSLGGFDLITLMKLLTYGAVPMFGIMMLVMMDSMVPKR